MKKKLLIASFCIIALINISEIHAQFVVKVRPTMMVRQRPVAPSRTHIWIGPEYVWRNGNYVLVNGYWAAPRVGFSYVPGRWKRQRGGHVWVAGGWRR